MSTQKDSSATALSFFTMDSSGKLMIKAQLGEDIRMLPLFNEDITYDELILMMQRVFKGKLSNMDDVTLKYKDEDGDLITIADTSDLNLATQRNRLLKITIFVKGREVLPLVDASVVKDVRRELTVIRDKVNSLLDALDITDKVPSKQPPDQQYQSSSVGQSLQTEVVQQLPPVSKAVTSFFDPLKSLPQTPVSESSTAVTVNQQTSTAYSSPASSIVGAPPTQQPSANSASSTGHLFGQQSQGTAPFLPQQQQQQQQQQQVTSLPSGNPSYSQQQQPTSYSQQQQQSQPVTSYQVPSAYGGQAGYSATSNVAPPSAASYPQQQQQYQATPTAGATAYPQGYSTSRYPSAATPPQPAAPVSSQAYSIFGANKSVSGYGQQTYQPYPY